MFYYLFNGNKCISIINSDRELTGDKVFKNDRFIDLKKVRLIDKSVTEKTKLELICSRKEIKSNGVDYSFITCNLGNIGIDKIDIRVNGELFELSGVINNTLNFKLLSNDKCTFLIEIDDINYCSDSLIVNSI